MPMRPRADTDTCVDYSCTEPEQCGKSGSFDEMSVTAAGSSLRISERSSWSDCVGDSDCDDAVEIFDNSTEEVVLPKSDTQFLGSCAVYPTLNEQMAMMACQMQQAPFYVMMPMAMPQTPEPEPAKGFTSTTVVLRRMPKELSSTQVRRMLDSAEFNGLYDFLYVPMDFKSSKNLGYALVNFITLEHATAARECFDGARMGHNALVAEISRKHHGLESLLEQYQKSHVLTDETLPEEYKPLLFCDGEVIAFPMQDCDAN